MSPPRGQSFTPVPEPAGEPNWELLLYRLEQIEDSGHRMRDDLAAAERRSRDDMAEIQVEIQEIKADFREQKAKAGFIGAIAGIATSAAYWVVNGMVKK